MRSRTEPLAATRATRIEHVATARRSHPGPEAMTALAHQLARLVGPLHGFPLVRERELFRATPDETRAHNNSRPRGIAAVSGGISLYCGGLYGRASLQSMHRVVMRGLDPRIHLVPTIYAKQMDPRVKPAGDGGSRWASARTLITFPRAGAQSNVNSR